MKCPACPDSDLLMAERQGVEIDYCPTCRGVWLDRGELDAIVQRSGDPGTRDPQTGQSPKPRHGKKGGFLSDLLGGLGD